MFALCNTSKMCVSKAGSTTHTVSPQRYFFQTVCIAALCTNDTPHYAQEPPSGCASARLIYFLHPSFCIHLLLLLPICDILHSVCLFSLKFSAYIKFFKVNDCTWLLLAIIFMGFRNQRIDNLARLVVYFDS